MAGILLEGENVTIEQRAAHARALSAEKAEVSRRRASELRARVGKHKLEQALRIPGDVIADEEIAAGGYYTATLGSSEHLRIIDLEGQQAVDFLCYDASDYENRYNAANTIKMNRSIYVGKGFKLYSDRADVLMTVSEDTVGSHDTIGGCCSSETNYLRYGIENTPSCRNNFIAALAEHGMGSRDIPANLNFFMYVPVGPDGATEIVEGRSEPGDFVELVAERDVLIAISNCPQVFNPCNGWNPTPIRVIHWRNHS
ncbi:DUF1989 domain-containing protein [Microvirga massiliensis]|uniref:DUF1989 domain-containing protein n=1 Tax=Microvirga massiliensis TaxID=1033741 RepID=UPI0009E3396D|nr:DUF1989 domain-containing protein [Microvirga massiliensis]